LAGFSNSGTGVWAYVDIREGDYISFLYAARALNLYRIVKKEAIVEFRDAPPWPPVTFRESNKTYFYPFRLQLCQERRLNEPIVRPEFAYVAENLLLRAGYRKTHFQADQTTLQMVSQMGDVCSEEAEPFLMSPHSIFTPRFTRRKTDLDVPFICPFNELILQAAIRHRIAVASHLGDLMRAIGVASVAPEEFEVLSEKAVSEGHVDILVKDSVPIGAARKIVLESKLAKAEPSDVTQLCGYTQEFGAECIGRALIAEGFKKGVAAAANQNGVQLIRYEIDGNWEEPKTFAEICATLKLTPAAES
jgi:hypothetical protein